MIADKKIQESENSSVELSITLTAQSVEDAYKALVTKYSKDMVIKGFRKGKAPIKLIESKYGEELRNESTYKLLEDDLKVALDDVEEKYKPLPYSTPVLQNEDELSPFKPNTDITYSVVYDVLPQFDVPEYKGLSIEVPTVSIKKENVDTEIEKLRNQNALIVSKEEPAKDGDIVTIDFAELNSEGKNDRNDFTVTIGTTPSFFNLDADLIGMSTDEEKTVSKELAADFADADYAGKTVEIKISMKAVKFNDIPELDDDFAQDVSEDYETVKDLAKGTKKTLQERAESKLKGLKFTAVTDALVEKCPLVAPKSMIDYQADQQLQNFAQNNNMDLETLTKIFGMQGQSIDQLKEAWVPMIQKQLNVDLILEKIKEAEKFEVTDEEIKEAMGDTTSYSPEQTDYVKDYITEQVKLAKVNDFLIENNIFTKGKKLSYDELMNGPAVEEIPAK